MLVREAISLLKAEKIAYSPSSKKRATTTTTTNNQTPNKPTNKQDKTTNITNMKLTHQNNTINTKSIHTKTN
jgi:hypothetical protein